MKNQLLISLLVIVFICMAFFAIKYVQLSGKVTIEGKEYSCVDLPDLYSDLVQKVESCDKERSEILAKYLSAKSAISELNRIMSEDPVGKYTGKSYKKMTKPDKTRKKISESD